MTGELLSACIALVAGLVVVAAQALCGWLAAQIAAEAAR